MNWNFPVLDLLKVMAMPPDSITVEEKWGFVVTKDECNPILIEVEIFDGHRRVATPAFLMALLIKQHLRVIKKECREKPTEIGFCLLDQFTKDERKRVEEQLKESCKLSKVECVFIKI